MERQDSSSVLNLLYLIDTSTLLSSTHLGRTLWFVLPLLPTLWYPLRRNKSYADSSSISVDFSVPPNTDWWKANMDKYSSWAEVRTEIELYYEDHYRADRAHLEIHKLRQTGPIQDYLNEIDRLNTYAKIPDRAMINIIINKLTGLRRRSMAHYEHLWEHPDECST